MIESFETYRSYLFAIAYRMLGSAMDAEDMVQETYLRYQRTPPETITSLKAFLTTIISRLCVDQLHLAHRKREQYLGPWLPEPIITAETLEVISTEERVDREESISMAFLLLLEQLQPVERAVFLLREVFDYDYAEIATFLGKSEVACRQWFSRAKKHLADHRPRFSTPPENAAADADKFSASASGGGDDRLNEYAGRGCHLLGRWRRQSQRSGNSPALLDVIRWHVSFWTTHPFSGTRYQRTREWSWLKSTVNQRLSRAPVIEPSPC